MRETAYFGPILRTLRKTVRFRINLHSIGRLPCSLLGRGRAVPFVTYSSLRVSMSVGVMIYYSLFGLALSRILRASKGGELGKKRDVG